MTLSKIGLVFALMACFATEVNAQKIYFADTYTTPNQIKKPSSLSFIKKADEDWNWQLDLAAWLQGAKGIAIFDVGVSMAIGSARKPEARVVSPVASINWRLSQVYLDVGFTYDATTSRDYEKPAIVTKLSPLTWHKLAIGLPQGKNPEFRWRPYIGFQAGRIESAKDTLEGQVGDDFTRITFATDAVLRIKKGTAPDAPTRFEITGSSAFWYLVSASETKAHLSGAFAVPVRDPDIWVQLKGERAQKPPAFVTDNTISLAIGIRK
jgi:hypothetical protein